MQLTVIINIDGLFFFPVVWGNSLFCSWEEDFNRVCLVVRGGCLSLVAITADYWLCRRSWQQPEVDRGFKLGLLFYNSRLLSSVSAFSLLPSSSPHTTFAPWHFPSRDSSMMIFLSQCCKQSIIRSEKVMFFFFSLPLALKVMSMSDVLFGHVTGRNNRNRTVGRSVSLF